MKQAKEMLRWNEEEKLQEHQNQKQTAGGNTARHHRNGQERSRVFAPGDVGPHEIKSKLTTTTGQHLAQTTTASSSLQPLPDALVASSSTIVPQGDAVARRESHEEEKYPGMKPREQNTGDQAEEGRVGHRGKGSDAGAQEGLERAAGGQKAGESRETNDVAFVLRKLYTGGGLDAQQQAWQCMPSNLFNTLTLQLGTLSKVSLG